MIAFSVRGCDRRVLSQSEMQSEEEQRFNWKCGGVNCVSGEWRSGSADQTIPEQTELSALLCVEVETPMVSNEKRSLLFALFTYSKVHQA